MSIRLRQSGLEIIGEVPWGTHFCQFYRTAEDLQDILAPYFAAGLANNEFCMWIVSEPLGVEAAFRALAAAVPGFDEYVRRGQIEIVPHTDWYLKDGTFEAGRVLDAWIAKLDAALAAGYEGLRLSGNTFWLEPKDWRAFTEYEAAIDGVIGRYRMMAACTYSVDRCGFDEILDVVRNHRFALVRRGGRWELVESARGRRAYDELENMAQFPGQNPNPVLRLTGDAGVLYANPAARAFLASLGSERDMPAPDSLARIARETLARPGAFETELTDARGQTYSITAVRPAGEPYVNLYFRNITARKVAEETLRENEEKYRLLFQNMGEGFALYELVDDDAGQAVDWRILEVNDAYARHTGIGRDRIVGRRAGESFPAAVPEYLPIFSRVVATQTPEAFETFATAVGRFERIFCFPAGGRRFACTVVDISDSKRLEAELDKKTVELQSLFNNTNAGLVLFDAERPHTVLVHNRGYQGFFGEPYRSQGVVGKNNFEYAPAVEARGVAAVFDEVLRTGRAVNLLDFAYDSNPPRQSWYDWHLSPVLRDGKIVALASMSIDVTARHEAEEGLKWSARRNGLLSRTAARLLQSEDPQGLIQDLCREVMAFLDCHIFFNFMADEGTRTLRLNAFDGVAAAEAAKIQKLDYGTAVCGSVARDRERILAEDIASRSDPLTDLVKSFGVQAYCCHPLMAQDRLIGTLSFGTRTRPRFSPEQVEVMRVVTDLAAMALQRVETEAALRQSRSDLARAQAVGQIGSWRLDVRRDVLAWSDETYRIFGVPAGTSLTYEAFLGLIHPDDRLMVSERWSAGLGGEPYDVEHRVVVDGRVKWIREKAFFERDEAGTLLGGFGIAQDVTERKNTEALRQALAEQERLRLGAAVEQASEAVVMLDLDGTIRYVNAAFEAINRIGREAAAGRSYFDLIAGGPAEAAAREALAKGLVWRGAVTRPIADGRPVELELTISPVKDPAGVMIGGLVTEKDVTRENALQKQFRQAQKMEALGTLAGGITHDFNNILGAIVINTELALLDLDRDHPAGAVLPAVLQAVERGKELVKQIITFSRQREWVKARLEIAPVVKDAMGLLRSTLPKDVVIHETIAPDCGVVLGDLSQIHQIVVNLCQNAALAMRDAGGTLDVRLEPVVVDADMAARHPDLKPGRFVRLTVADSGCGMAPEIMERIFEPFFTTRAHGGGSGLGLPVVLGIVKSCNGAIVVYSEPGKGSVFNVYLPRLEGEAPASRSAPARRVAGSGERILIVEDEPSQRASLARSLTKLGYCVAARASGRSALSLFRKDPAAFDVLISDQTMPGMSGLELAAAVRKDRPDLPVILCTGFSEKMNGDNVGSAGVRGYVMKPFTLQEISRLIAKALGKAAGDDEKT